MILTLQSPVINIKGIGKKYAETLNQNGIITILDFLYHFPVDYINFQSVSNDIHPGVNKVYGVCIERVKIRRTFKKKRSLITIIGQIGEVQVQILVFNKPYLVDFLNENPNVFIFGCLERKEHRLQAINPRIFAPQDMSRRPILPVYRSIASIKSGTLINIFENIFENIEDHTEILPAWIVDKYRFIPLVKALRVIHFPRAVVLENIKKVKERFIYGEFFYFQLELQYIRNFFTRKKRFHSYHYDMKIKQKIDQNLEFPLTKDQIQAFEDIVNDLTSETTMQRLLQGDVGSGKTVVAFMALLLAVENGNQGAFLAPTEILASQHYLNGCRFFKGIDTAVITGSTTPREKKEIYEKLDSGSIQIVFGTHALLNENLKFNKLSLIVIDEQHRFGVSQRAALYYKGRGVDLLVTTATPIPRTMLLTLYRDLSISTIFEKPLGRKPIRTKLIRPEQRDEFYHWLKQSIAIGEKAFIIIPLVEKSDFFTGLRSLEADSEYYRKNFNPFSVGMLTGRNSPLEKKETLDAFRTGTIRILLATTVVEVGLDICDATIMVIENADRYGLAQLHQLRGRVGRGERQSQCYLLPGENSTENGQKRLNIIASTQDGFEIAEKDLEMRGGGIIAGLEQSGTFDFKVADIKKDFNIFKQARNDVRRILRTNAIQNGTIKKFIDHLKERIKYLNFS